MIEFQFKSTIDHAWSMVVNGPNNHYVSFQV
ncbi:hypothetical protein FP742_16910 [Vibrio parahaemolyticus]|uniref:Uncharacterized protein n=1 Tax=Vibrio parahaemolyticus serotype O3:K6 (strain RIMD 2210633) TaxID=223926 RepID=Q87KS2_VIBPA|nr:hypothetical protein A6J30_25185 [Vibrio parahaemolyticus]BAC61167.1 hypothetical protein [Vibrio parahaemolyticus RIMD 2210633]AZV69633.1 hypothetical protein D0853_00920 [Vibrio parahaemolyticus]EGQ8459024.1 hypothetical protein [Vibrio parahaemolyticus]EGQ8464258.1 hypothetical protein [Vibrio parahaemolyticus]